MRVYFKRRKISTLIYCPIIIIKLLKLINLDSTHNRSQPIKKTVMKTTYNKLIRDKIPQIIEENKQTPIIKKLNEKEFTKELFKKLKEEMWEVVKAKDDKKELMKELSDVYEVIDAIIDLYKLDKDSILKLQEDKRQERGGFKERIFLMSVKEK